MSTTTMTVTDHERGLLAAVGGTARTSNAADAQLVRQITDYINSRCIFAAAAPGARFDAVTAVRSAIAELALELSSSFQSVAGLNRLGLALAHISVVLTAFDAGEITLQKVRVIVDHTRGATRPALNRLDKAIACAARRLAPTPLGVEIDRLLVEDDATWAERARKEAEAAAKVRTKRRAHGMGVLTVTMSAEQIAAVTSLIAEVARTVCYADPRTTDELCVAAFLAITQGDRTLACHCTRQECTARTNPEPAPPQVRVNIMCGLETLLGLADNPGYLAGYGYLDPAQTRALAEDSSWQALMDCAAETLERLRKQAGCTCDTSTPCETDRDASDVADSADTRADSGSDDDNSEDGPGSYGDDGDPDGSGGDGGGGPGPEPETPDPTPQTEHEPAPESGQRVFKSPIVPAGAIRLPVRPAPTYPRPLTNPAPTIADILFRQLRDCPDTIEAAFPDGHGGFTHPPPGALTYRPNDLLAAAVRLRDGTCRHPGCSMPAADCQLDHVVAFLKANPRAGGWTILANLQCLCVLHHQLKTDGMWHHEMLAGAVMHIHNKLGQHSFTLPTRRRAQPSRKSCA